MIRSVAWSGASRRLFSGWFALLFAPAVFFAHLQTASLLDPWSCGSGNTVWLHLVSGVATVLAGLGAWVAWRLWEQVDREGDSIATGEVPRAGFLAVTGLASSAMITLVLLAQWATEFVIGACQ